MRIGKSKERLFASYRIRKGRKMKDEAPLLYSRIEAGRMLGGISVASLRRLEAAGALKPVKLSGKRAGQTFYRAAEVRSLVDEGADPKRDIKRKGGRS
jgi:hypothetical protein